MTNFVDNREVERFGAVAADWWNPEGKFRPLHKINPARLFYIREQLLAHTGRDARSLKPFSGLTILDAGCGGGLVAEPLARLGARVTGLDPSPETIAVAKGHAGESGLDIEYLTGTTHDLAGGGRGFDCVLALEVVEHVPDVGAFLASCAALSAPGGLVILSTLNRTAKSYALGIVAAEYILGWLPKGTHSWSRFITPDELRVKLREAGLEPTGERGLAFDPLRFEWKLTDDCEVNYFMTARK
ncbi:MAG: bifunctional 2-polyprenyl-6-hydroxyphenol methylase/3-demethylubiquinol 3-O-methyltransferase UbiG [Rhodomicrobium sp.]|nr:bifunctional 2-polyprenyl-6-hydroxyphenol methylase/3-demethylubiquinol 3-O-methyltransferase UbiG [Rhodomicrobium sp.]